jgi:hypothetical protein
MHPNETDQHNHHKEAWMLSFAVFAFGINANIASAQTATQKQALKKCGVGLVLPSWLPPGFKMTSFKLNNCPLIAFKAMTPPIQDPINVSSLLVDPTAAGEHQALYEHGK